MCRTNRIGVNIVGRPYRGAGVLVPNGFIAKTTGGQNIEFAVTIEIGDAGRPRFAKAGAQYVLFPQTGATRILKPGNLAPSIRGSGEVKFAVTVKVAQRNIIGAPKIIRDVCLYPVTARVSRVLIPIQLPMIRIRRVGPPDLIIDDGYVWLAIIINITNGHPLQ